MLPFRQLADQFTLIFCDHRCNGRSRGAPASSMTFENLTADADALRQMLGYEHRAVLGHLFGGHVALEYALRYPGSVSHLVLEDTGGDSRWSRDNAARLLAARGYSPAKVDLVRRLFRGEFPARRMPLIMMRIGSADCSHPSLSLVVRGGRPTVGRASWPIVGAPGPHRSENMAGACRWTGMEVWRPRWGPKPLPRPGTLGGMPGVEVGTVITVLTVEAALEHICASFRERADLEDITPAERDLLIDGAILLAMHIDDLAPEGRAGPAPGWPELARSTRSGRHERYPAAAAA